MRTLLFVFLVVLFTALFSCRPHAVGERPLGERTELIAQPCMHGAGIPGEETIEVHIVETEEYRYPGSGKPLQVVYIYEQTTLSTVDICH